MPLTKITNKEYLNTLASLSPTILNEYIAALPKASLRVPGQGVQGWSIMEILYKGENLPNADYLPTLKSALSNLPSNIYPAFCWVSAIKGGELTDEKKHYENYPLGLIRYHITLQASPKASINIQEDDEVWRAYTWEDNSVYNLESTKNMHYLSFNEVSDKDRIIIVLDVFEDTPPTPAELDMSDRVVSSFLLPKDR